MELRNDNYRAVQRQQHTYDIVCDHYNPTIVAIYDRVEDKLGISFDTDIYSLSANDLEKLLDIVNKINALQ